MVGCGKDEFSELADANGVYRMNRSRRRGGIRLISGDMSEEFEPKSEPSLDRVEGGERPGPGAFLIRRPGPVWLWSLSSGGREESEPARAGGTYNLSGMCGGVAGPPISRGGLGLFSERDQVKALFFWPEVREFIKDAKVVY